MNFGDSINKAVESFETSVARHPVRVLIIGLIVTIIAGGFASQLPIVTSRKALFPQDTPSLVRLNSFLHKFGAGSDLMVVVKDAPLPVLKSFATDLAQTLRKQPSIRDATERLDTKFFARNSFLIIPPAILGQIRKGIDDNSKVLKLVGTTTVDKTFSRVSKWLDDPPPVSVTDMNIKATTEGLSRANFILDQWKNWILSPKTPKTIPWARLTNHPEAERFLHGGGYFLSHDNKMLVVLVTNKNPSENNNILGPFIAGVRKAATTLRAKYKREGKPVPTFGLTGLPAVENEEYNAIRADILLIIVTAGIFVLLLILFWMRSWRRALVIFIPMGLGAIWNTALTLGTVGHLTLITAGFTAILFGMGVDYGIFMSSRISDGVAHGMELTRAIGRGAADSGRALLTAGGATTLIFGSLYFVPFKGFSELGLVAATGVFLVLISTFTILPAVYALLKPPVNVVATDGRDTVVTKPWFSMSKRTSAVVVIIALITAAWGVWKGSALPFDYDALALLPKHSEAAKYQKLLVKNTDFQPEVIIFTAPTMKRAREVVKQAKKALTLSNVQSVVDLFPTDMSERINLARMIGKRVAMSGVAGVLDKQADVRLSLFEVKRLGKIIEQATGLVDDFEEQAMSSGNKSMVAGLEKVRKRLEILSGLAKKDPERFAKRTSALFNTLLHTARKVAAIIKGWRDVHAMTPSRLPPSLRHRFFAKDGTIAIYAYPRESVYNVHNLDRLMKDVYAIDKDATGFPTTHQVFSRMAVNSFRQGTVRALIVALLWIFLSVRSLRGFIVASLPLLVGEGWLMGILIIFGMKFNYANIVAVPLVMALAVDYGVWFAHRRKELAKYSSWVAASDAARAIGLAAGTTLAGLGAIMLASYRGVASMGQCITIGLVACIIAALIVAPAIDQLMGRYK